ALIMDDPDAREPAGKIWDHWVVWNIDLGNTELPEDWSAGAADEGLNDYGEQGYGGPNPPDREHTYYFKLYALDTQLDLPSSTNSSELENAMNPHIIDETELTGTYSP
ncbi:MAG: YbhB/YbcL family Raf kinase inhibitor-like protein, partial [bacterium]